MKRTAAYQDTYQHYTENIIPAVGLERVRDVYRDALFLVNVPPERLAALRDAIEDAEVQS